MPTRVRNLMLFVCASTLSMCRCDGPPPPGQDGGTDAGAQVVDACPALNGTVVSKSQDITQDETWVGDGTVYRVTFSITVRPGATLTLGPCARVQVNPGLEILVAGDVPGARPAKLLAAGTPTQRVRISRFDEARPWGDIRAYGPNSFLDFSYTDVVGAGSLNTVDGWMVMARGTPSNTAVDKVVRFIGVTLTGSQGGALVLEAGAAFSDDSADIVISGGGLVPPGPAAHGGAALQVSPLALNSLPRSLTIADNNPNTIRVSGAPGSLAFERDVTVKNLGVPYYFYFDRVRVHSKTATPTLTFEAGVEARFDDYLMVGVGANTGPAEPGKLIAVGTAMQPIVFTGAKKLKTSGDWPGVYLHQAPGSQLTHVRIEAAGAFNGIVSANCRPSGTSDWAALFIGAGDDSWAPSAGDFSNVSIVNSASHGINAMWRSSTFGPDLTGGFTFSNIAGCRQTRNGTPTGCGTQLSCLVP